MRAHLPARRRSFRPRLEALEGRCTPACSVQVLGNDTLMFGGVFSEQAAGRLPVAF